MSKKKFVDALFSIVNRVWVWYSDFYWINIKKSVPLFEFNTPLSNEDFDGSVLSLINTIMSENFDYAYDFIDNVLPPFVAYDKYKSGKLYEDCDGYHSCIYHIFKSNMADCGIEDVRLLTVNPYENPTKGHCVFVFKRKGVWNLIDYNILHKFNCETVDECAIKYYNEAYKSTCVASENTTTHYATYSYDYNKKKWRVIDKENL